MEDLEHPPLYLTISSFMFLEEEIAFKQLIVPKHAFKRLKFTVMKRIFGNKFQLNNPQISFLSTWVLQCRFLNTKSWFLGEKLQVRRNHKQLTSTLKAATFSTLKITPSKMDHLWKIQQALPHRQSLILTVFMWLVLMTMFIDSPSMTSPGHARIKLMKNGNKQEFCGNKS